MTGMAVVVVWLSVNVRSEKEDTHHRNITSTTSHTKCSLIIFERLRERAGFLLLLSSSPSLSFSLCLSSHRSEPFPYIEFVVRKYGYFYYDINKFVLIPTNIVCVCVVFFIVAFVFFLLCVVCRVVWCCFGIFFSSSSFFLWWVAASRHSHAQCEF